MQGIFLFEDIGDKLPLVPLGVRRALDAAGCWLSLAAWKNLPLANRRALVALGTTDAIDVEAVRDAVEDADPPVNAQPGSDDDALDEKPDALADALSSERWGELSRLERFALRHLAGRGNIERLQRGLAEIAPSRPTHLDDRGDARMVDVGAKSITARRAIARARVRMRPETAQLVVDAGTAKGDVLATARIAGIMAAKRTSELIPLCHQIALSRVAVAFEVDVTSGTIDIRATADAHDRTGVEMEAMTSASVAALTIYDMLKGVERGIAIEEIVLLEKQGGRSGHYRRTDPAHEDET